MKESLSYVLVTPYTIAKSRTGGVLSRLLSSVDLDFVGAQMIAVDEQLALRWSEYQRAQSDPKNPFAAHLLADYLYQKVGPNGGRKHRSLLLLFRGENACRKLSDICGALYAENRSIESLTGETIRDTYSDLIYDRVKTDTVTYFEPAVFTPRNQKYADTILSYLAEWLPTQSNIIENVIYPDDQNIEQTLVIIKPDNWCYASSRPGTIVDMFSKTGLRIVGIKVHQMSVAEALKFYGPVEEALKKKLAPTLGKKAKILLEEELNLTFSEKTEKALTESFGLEYSYDQFEQIIEFMSGYRPSKVPFDERDSVSGVKTLILIYEGVDACAKIREVLGPTDPSKAPEGTVRREFGKNVMVNTAHASDSVESAKREIEITNFHYNRCAEIIATYLQEG